MKYYFITFMAKNRDGNQSYWNECIDYSPMKYIKDSIEIEEKGDNNYYNFVIINTLEITKEEFNEYDGRF